MTTGRINQVHTVPSYRRAPPRGPGRERARPQPGLAQGPLELCPHLAGPRPRLLLSPSQSRSERRRRHASSRGAPLGTVRPRIVTRTKACDPSAAASALPLGRPPPAETPPGYAAATARLMPVSTRRRTGARIRTPLAGCLPGPGSAVLRSRRPGRRQRSCRRELCVLTRRGCPILYVPAQRTPAKMEALLPSRFWEGRREASSPPKMAGEERGLLLPSQSPERVAARGRVDPRRLHARTFSLGDKDPCASPDK